MGIRRTLLCTLMLAALRVAIAQSAAEPTLLSVFPLGGTGGSKVDLAVRGENLLGAYGVLFDCPALQGKLTKVQEIRIEPKDPKEPKEGDRPRKGQLVSVEVVIAATAKPGSHAMRLVTPRGVSGPLWFVVNAEPVTAETDAKHDTPADAQPVKIPGVVNGKLSQPGEVDYYSFEARKGQRLQFEVVTFSFDKGGVAGDPELTLYEPSKSWFNPQKGARLEVNDHSRPGLGDFPDTTSHRLPRLTRVFEKPGRYVAQLRTMEGEGGPDYSYQLRITALEGPGESKDRWGPIVQAPEGEGLAWRTRSFAGALEPDRIEQLASRGPALRAHPGIPTIHEDEPNDTPELALALAIPVLIEGVVQRPGDTDYFRFRVEPKQQLTFEVETPYLPPPYFNPRMAVADDQGNELLTNIYTSLGGDGDDWIKTVQQKVTYAFEKGGEYRLQVRDLTSRLGNSDFAYRILIRPQVPHLGEIEARTGSPSRRVDHINLAGGESQRISVFCDLEEGFQGEVALTVENLPPGVSAFPAITTLAEKPTATAFKPGGAIHKERFIAPRESATLVFVAEPDAQPTTVPYKVELKARPIVQGKPGLQLLVQYILMAITPAATGLVENQPGVEATRKK